MPANIRVGRQVLSWGESTFIFNGINAINPVDVNAIRRPGVEIKEALLPVGMVNLNLGLTDETSLDMFYQYEWDDYKLDGCGTFFSTVDILGGPGCNKVTLNPQLVPGDPNSNLSDLESIAFGTYLERRPDIQPDDGGQYGFALRHYATSIDTEFGAYFMNIHTQTPIISAYNWQQQPSPALSHPDGIPIAGPDYVLQFPEDQKIFGFSASTLIGQWSVGGEVSHRLDMPVQINTTEILTAGLRAGVPSTFSNRIQRDSTGAITNLGELQEGYDEYDVTQWQLTGVRFIDRALGADRITFIGEVAVSKVHGLVDLDEQRYGRNPVFGKCLTVADQNALGNPAATADINCEGFVTPTSWGYRARLVGDYNNVFSGWNMTPTIAFGHDVKGYSANSNFIEDRRTLGLSVDFSYLSRYKIGIGYNMIDGAEFDPADDRDFAAVSFSYSF